MGGGQALAHVVKADDHLVAVHGVRSIQRSVRLRAGLVDLAERHLGGTVAVAPFIGRVNARTEVAGRHHPGVGIVLHQPHVQVALLARAKPFNVRQRRRKGFRIAGDRVVLAERASAAAGLLHKQEGELALAPALAPATNQLAHHGVLVHADDARAGFALIPEHAADPVANHRLDELLVQPANLAAATGLARIGGRVRLAAARLLPLGLGRSSLLLPSSQPGLVLSLGGFLVVSLNGGGNLIRNQFAVGKGLRRNPGSRRSAPHGPHDQSHGNV